ncbi:dipeptidyl peptidase 3, partial [bacterium]|nr:dipeptidyl peptidase 3 [bacterium]
RDIMWDQNFKHNLAIRKVMEGIYTTYTGSKDAEDFKKFDIYAKRVWFSNGIHHHYGNDKMLPDFSETYFKELVNNSEVGDKNAAISTLWPIMSDPAISPKKVDKSSDADNVAKSAINFYEGVTQAEVEAYYNGLKDKNDKTPISYGLNTKVMKENGKIVEKVWKVGGMYTEAIEKVVYWLEKATTVTENDKQKIALEKLITFYKTGDLKDFDAYSIAWVDDTDSKIDVINGFIEVYNDPIGYKGSFESVVAIRDPEASKRIEAISKEAKYFEENSPIADNHKKPDVKGISARVINVVMESGDASPSTPIGINLPNANWIRKDFGSKSVNLANIVSAYDEGASSGKGTLSEFALTDEEKALTKKWGSLADNLHTDMHEVIGHASGQIEPGVGTPKETLKNYSSTLEEGRADLVGLYYIMDQKLIDLGLMTTLDVAKVAYDDYIRNAMLIQLTRVKLGDNIEEAHMRNRAWVTNWAYEKGKEGNVIEKKIVDGKTYFVVNDYEKLRNLFGQLLKEVQRIKSQGDYAACKELVESYGVKVDQTLHKEVLDRFAKLNLAPYTGFINPELTPVMDGENITDVKITYPDNFVQQMLGYGEKYGFLPIYN